MKDTPNTTSASASYGTMRPSHFFTTRLLPRPDQFDAWRQHYAGTIDLSLTDKATQGFIADLVSWDLGGIVFTHALLPGAAAPRFWRHLARSYMDHWCVVLARSYRPGLETRYSPAALTEHLSFRSLARPFEGHGADDEVLTLLVPRDAFTHMASSFDRAHDAILQPGLAGILAEFMTTLGRQLPLVSAGQLPGLAGATRAMLEACIVPSTDGMGMAQEPIESILFDRARRIVKQNMGTPEFGPEALCRALSISRSKLYRMFEATGGVARFIQRERLHKARARLAEARDHPTISVVAGEVGFVDHSTFSRSFKREFGFSPTEARDESLSRRLGASRGPAAMHLARDLASQPADPERDSAMFGRASDRPRLFAPV